VPFRAQDLPGGLEEQQIPAVVGDQVVAQHPLGGAASNGLLVPRMRIFVMGLRITGRGRAQPTGSRIAPSWLRIRAVAPPDREDRLGRRRRNGAASRGSSVRRPGPGRREEALDVRLDDAGDLVR
jgi:hypothetical protein